jgi:hypothetical protein
MVRFRRRSKALPLLIGSLVALPAVGLACGGDETSPASLKDRVIPAANLKLKSEREFEWDNPTDFVVEGIHGPEKTRPSDIISAIDEAGFEAAAGRQLIAKGGEPGAHVSVARFDSEDGARQARDYLHEQDLQQPCFAACVVNPREHTVRGIPDSLAVYHEPIEGEPPPGLFKFVAFKIEFTIGEDLYVLDTMGAPGKPTEAQFDRWAKAFYEHASGG